MWSYLRDVTPLLLVFHFFDFYQLLLENPGAGTTRFLVNPSPAMYLQGNETVETLATN